MVTIPLNKCEVWQKAPEHNRQEFNGITPTANGYRCNTDKNRSVKTLSIPDIGYDSTVRSNHTTSPENRIWNRYTYVCIQRFTRFDSLDGLILHTDQDGNTNTTHRKRLEEQHIVQSNVT